MKLKKGIIKISLLTTVFILGSFTVYAEQPLALTNPDAQNLKVDWDDQITSYIETAHDHGQGSYNVYIEKVTVSEADAWLTVSYKTEQADTEYIEIARILIPGVTVRNDQCSTGILHEKLVGKTIQIDSYPRSSLTIWSQTPEDLAEWLVVNGLATRKKSNYGDQYVDGRKVTEMTVADFNTLSRNVTRDDLTPKQEVTQFNKTGLWWQQCDGLVTTSEQDDSSNTKNLFFYIAGVFLLGVFIVNSVRIYKKTQDKDTSQDDSLSAKIKVDEL